MDGSFCEPRKRRARFWTVRLCSFDRQSTKTERLLGGRSAQDMYNHRAKRQLNAFFDYDTWQDQRQNGVGKKAKPDKSRKKKKTGIPEWYKRD